MQVNAQNSLVQGQKSCKGCFGIKPDETLVNNQSLSLLSVLFLLSVTFSTGLLVNEDKSQASVQMYEQQYITYNWSHKMKKPCPKDYRHKTMVNAAFRQLNTVVKQKQHIYQQNLQGFQPTHNFKLLSYISLDVQQEDLSKMSAECQELEWNKDDIV